jgi:site-specific DNA recombinase
LVAAGSLDLLTGVPLSEIARRWTAAGTTGTRGAVWDGRTVGQVLTRARNAALVEHHGQVLGRAQWPAILEEGAWRAVCAVMADPARRTSPGGERRHLLTGVALCGGCGNPLVVNGGGPQPARYLCTRAAKTLPRRPNQIHVGRQVTLVDTAVRALVLARLSRDDAEGLLRADTSGERGNLIIRETELDARYRGQYDLYLAGTIDEVDLARGRKKIKDDLDEVRGRRVALEEADLLALWLSDPEGEWERRSVYDRRAVVETLMMITLMPARRGPRPAGYKVGRSWFNPELIDVRWRRALPSDR